MVLSMTCKCGTETTSLAVNEFCSKAGGAKLEACGDKTIEDLNCFCGTLEGFIGQSCASSVLECKYNAVVVSKSCKCGTVAADALIGQFCKDGSSVIDACIEGN